jgi:pimeloyl-ACP methyl ester carboxylesterase
VLVSLLSDRYVAERFGSGPDRVLALHGWGRTRADWAPVLERTGGLALDLRGFGSAPAPEEGWDTRNYADDLVPLVESLDRPVLVGHSFGGRIAARIAANHPDLVGALLLTGTPLIHRGGTAKAPPLGYRLAKLGHRARVISDARMEAARNKYGSEDYRNAHGVVRSVLVRTVNERYDDVIAELRDYPGRIELVWGEHDTAAPADLAAQLAERTGGTLTVVPGAGHLLEPALAATVGERIETLLECTQRSAP